MDFLSFSPGEVTSAEDTGPSTGHQSHGGRATAVAHFQFCSESNRLGFLNLTPAGHIAASDL